MLLQHKVYFLTPHDAAMDIPFRFEVPEQTTLVKVCLRFSPAKETDVSLCHEPIRQAINAYYAGDARAFSEDSWHQYMPLKNLVTVSLDYAGGYLGNAHRWDSDQVHIFTATQPPDGFLKPAALSGCWGGMLHVHEIVSTTCRVELTVTVEGT